MDAEGLQPGDRLDEAGHAKEAIADRSLAKEVAEFKSRFFREKDRKGNAIDYMAAVSGKLQLSPDADVGKTTRRWSSC